MMFKRFSNSYDHMSASAQYANAGTSCAQSASASTNNAIIAILDAIIVASIIIYGLIIGISILGLAILLVLLVLVRLLVAKSEAPWRCGSAF